MIIIKKVNELYCCIETDAGIEKEINEYFSFFTKNYKYMPTYRSGCWDGKIRLFNNKTKQLYSSLIPNLLEFASVRNYKVSNSSQFLINLKSEVSSFLENYESYCNFQPYDYQFELVERALLLNKAIISSSVGSGKSLMLYLYFRFIKDIQKGRMLLIVPTISLVEQMRKDFINYCKDYDIAKDIYSITGGIPKDIKSLKNCSLVISTYQSIYKLPKSWYNYFHTSEFPGRAALAIDECHLADGKSLSSIINNCSDFEFRLGTSGSIKSSKTHVLQLTGLLGPVIKVNSTKDLMNRNILTELEIHNLILDYSDEEKKLFANNTNYQIEMKFLTTHEKRNKLITNLAIKETGNILLLFNYLEQGRILCDLLKDSGKKVIYLDGSTSAEERENARIFTEANDGVIIVGSFNILSTGVNIKKLHTVVFCHNYKSFVKNVQSIGRILRKHESKEKAKLIDFTDNLSYKGKPNFAFLHAMERRRIYKSEQFDVKDIKIDF